MAAGGHELPPGVSAQKVLFEIETLTNPAQDRQEIHRPDQAQLKALMLGAPTGCATNPAGRAGAAGVRAQEPQPGRGRVRQPAAVPHQPRNLGVDQSW